MLTPSEITAAAAGKAAAAEAADAAVAAAARVVIKPGAAAAIGVVSTIATESDRPAAAAAAAAATTTSTVAPACERGADAVRVGRGQEDGREEGLDSGGRGCPVGEGEVAETGPRTHTSDAPDPGRWSSLSLASPSAPALALAPAAPASSAATTGAQQQKKMSPCRRPAQDPSNTLPKPRP